MPTLAYRIVDVFSARPLGGNALCVVLDDTPVKLHQGIARETNLSETTFPTITGTGAYRSRIYTPTGELPFAGHPTLGTAWALGPGRWEQTTAGATVVVDVDTDGARMIQPKPHISAVDRMEAEAAAGLEQSIGAWIAEAGGVRHLILAAAAPITELAPDLAGVAAVSVSTGTTTFAVIHRRNERELQVRVFVPSMGIAEDPGTGSVAGPIGIVARSLWTMEPELTIHQGAEVGRPSIIEVDLRSEDGPVVGGRVSACAEGRFTLDA